MLISDYFFVVGCNDCVASVNYDRVCSFSLQRARFLHGIDPQYVFHFSVQFTVFSFIFWRTQYKIMIALKMLIY